MIEHTFTLTKFSNHSSRQFYWNIPRHGSENVNNLVRSLNQGFSSNFSAGQKDQYKSDVVRSAQQPKCCECNNSVEDGNPRVYNVIKEKNDYACARPCYGENSSILRSHARRRFSVRKMNTYTLIGGREFDLVQKWTINSFIYEDVRLISLTEVINKTLQNLTKPAYLEYYYLQSEILFAIQRRRLLHLGIRNWLHHETDVGS